MAADLEVTEVDPEVSAADLEVMVAAPVVWAVEVMNTTIMKTTITRYTAFIFRIPTTTGVFTFTLRAVASVRHYSRENLGEEERARKCPENDCEACWRGR